MNDALPPVGPLDRSSHEILVVDDDPASRYFTSRLLRSVGFRTREAASGMEALRLADEGLSAVILDVHLPDLDGFEVCQVLRTRPGLATMPVVHLSAAYVTDEDKVRGLDAGADAYLTHPVEPAVIVATVQALVRARTAENAMRQSEAKFRAIYAHAASGICLIDAGGRFADANAAMLELIGRSADAVLGHRVDEFAPEKARAGISERLARPLSEPWRDEFPLLDPDGQAVQIEWRVTPLAGTATRLAIATDVSDRVLLEQARATLLEREQHARGEAERVSRLKDDLIAVLSHELRSPLNAIMSWTHVLLLADLPPDVRKGLLSIERNGVAQARLLADILDTSRINTGKLRLELSLADPAELLRTAIEDIRPALQGSEIVPDLASDCPPVMVDQARFQQVLWNLLSNAAKFSPKGAPIGVALRPRGDGVRISVSDRGNGIDPAFLPFIFDRFSQGDVRRSRPQGGIGLGLAIVSQLVRLHHGDVSAESAGPGKGSVFHVDLPAASAASRETPSVAKTAPAGRGVRSDDERLRGLSVLIVDDDAEACSTLAMILRNHGGEVFTAHDHDAALAMLATMAPDVLISDLGMPGKNGFDLLRRVRSTEAPGTRMAAIALTAFSREADVRQALEAGFDAHCAKPLRPIELIDTITGLASREAPQP